MNYLLANLERRSARGVEEAGPLRFVASTENVARDGVALSMARMDLEAYRKNPVVLWAHDYGGRNLPIGRADARVEGQRLLADVTFDEAGDSFAAAVADKYRRGFLSAVSIGWDDYVRCPKCGAHARAYGSVARTKCPGCGSEITDTAPWHELMDISAVPVGSDPSALLERARAMRVASLAELVWETQLMVIALRLDALAERLR